MQLTEEFLHYIWQFRLLTKRVLSCTNGEELVIVQPGLLNTNAGPDFSMAELRIAGQRWVGNIEIHLKSSDWLLHHHHQDKSYDTVILHAVYENDLDILRADGTSMPVLLLNGLIPETLYDRYKELILHKSTFPCAGQIAAADPRAVTQMLEMMAEERLADKHAGLQAKLERNHYHWNEVFYYLLIRGFGFKVNTVPFEILADALGGKLLVRHRNQPLQLAALLFGQAGFLEAEFRDDYPRRLKTEFQFLRKKYQLTPTERSVWKFLRVHPQNFQVLRIAQLAAMLVNRDQLFAAMLGIEDHHQLIRFFACSTVHPYWKTHTDFDQECRDLYPGPGRKSIENLIMNTVCLLLYSYGKYAGQEKYLLRAVQLLKKMPAEQNVIVRLFHRAGIKPANAYESQALLQLHKSWCVPKKCLFCAIGRSIICG